MELRGIRLVAPDRGPGQGLVMGAQTGVEAQMAPGALQLPGRQKVRGTEDGREEQRPVGGPVAAQVEARMRRADPRIQTVGLTPLE